MVLGCFRCPTGERGVPSEKREKCQYLRGESIRVRVASQERTSPSKITGVVPAKLPFSPLQDSSSIPSPAHSILTKSCHHKRWPPPCQGMLPGSVGFHDQGLPLPTPGEKGIERELYLGGVLLRRARQCSFPAAGPSLITLTFFFLLPLLIEPARALSDEIVRQNVEVPSDGPYRDQRGSSAV